ncbi:MAG TPA: YebB family permuted papain-like enzyme [Gallionellaceae bacterium]|nr:YebB family permuted papain-like enzyme [Gallionellaceae bacterium]
MRHPEPARRERHVYRTLAPLTRAELPGWPLHTTAPQAATLGELGGRLQVGDTIFVRVRLLPFRKVAETTRSWTNHVGIVVDLADGEPVIAEGRIPFSGTTTWARFVRRSEDGRVALARLKTALDAGQQAALLEAARKRYRIPYDPGFNLHSRRQFCSRFVREVVDEAAGVKLGEVERFCDLLARNPQADRRFWRLWYLGAIPWQRETVTPASLLRDERLHIYFDGNVE